MVQDLDVLAEPVLAVLLTGKSQQVEELHLLFALVSSFAVLVLCYRLTVT